MHAAPTLVRIHARSGPSVRKRSFWAWMFMGVGAGRRNAVDSGGPQARAFWGGGRSVERGRKREGGDGRRKRPTCLSAQICETHPPVVFWVPSSYSEPTQRTTHGGARPCLSALAKRRRRVCPRDAALGHRPAPRLRATAASAPGAKVAWPGFGASMGVCTGHALLRSVSMWSCMDRIRDISPSCPR